MSKSQRSKGAAGERELCTLLYEHLGVRLVRNLEQSRRGGYDLIPHPDATGPIAAWLARYAIEVKRHATAPPHLLKQWWSQAETQARAVGLVPCLAYRTDRSAWRLLLPLSELLPNPPPWTGVQWTVQLSLEGFCALATSTRSLGPARSGES